MSNQVAAKVSMALTSSLSSSSSSHQNSQQRLYEERLSLSVCLSLGDKFLSKNQFEEANKAFDSANLFLTTTPSVAQASCGQESLKLNHAVSTLSSSSASTTSKPQTHIDAYHEEECNVGPRTFNAIIVPEDAMGLDIDVLQLMIAYNQALVYHASKNYPLASQLYKFITGTIGMYITSGNADATLRHLAMRAHNNLGEIVYTERSEEYAQSEFEKALAYARHHYNVSRVGGSTTSIVLQSGSASIQINLVTTPPDHQLEIATVLSNWCRARWVMGHVDQNLCRAMNDVLQIRTTNLRADHPDIAVAHFNIGRLEYSRHSNGKALKHLLQYMQIASSTFQENNTKGYVKNITDKNKHSSIELDPIQGLIYVLQIQNEGKDDEISADLVWSLRTLRDKRQDFGLIHSDVASVLNYIGTLLFRRREFDYALCFFSQELRVEEELKSKSAGKKPIGADEDVSISVTCNNIGRILQELGRYQEAKYYYQRSLGEEKISFGGKYCTKKCICKKEASDDDSDGISDIPAAAMNLYSTVWYNLGLIHDKMGAFKEAIRSFRMSLKLRRAMLGHEHSDVSCLYYNIGVLQMEQKLLSEATESFRQALAFRHVAGKGQLNDLHVIKTLQKLSSMHKAKGNVTGALEAYQDILSVLSTSNDLDHRIRSIKMAIVMRDIADLHQAQGHLQLALKHALGSVDLFRDVRTSVGNNINAMNIDNASEDERSYIEEEASALHLVGAIQHELCEPLEAQKAFSETARLVHAALITLPTYVATSIETTKLAATLLPLLEVSTVFSSPSCAPVA
jgi:tetratricopeptide (TPR) repeat protein